MQDTGIDPILVRLARRAESLDREVLVDTFVDLEPMFTLLGSYDHQVVYGRRGTGKTHALTYLAGTVAANGDVPVLLDLRLTGSTGGIYSDSSVAGSERATRLLSDTLMEVHDAVVEYVLADESDRFELSVVGPALDEFVEAISEVEVTGPIVRENLSMQRVGSSDDSATSASLSGQGPGIGWSSSRGDSAAWGSETRLREEGDQVAHVTFGHVNRALSNLVRALSPARLWVLLDEWVAVPRNLQPYLADLLRRAVFPVQGVTVKIGAIEHRSRFRVSDSQSGGYVGIELGADAAADLDLDDFMVFEYAEERSTEFFRRLLFEHYKAMARQQGADVRFGSPEELVQGTFVQPNSTFKELVRAAEGVPRDVINILSKAVLNAGNSPRITVDHVRSAALTWYSKDKERAVESVSNAVHLLHWINDEVIGHRKARAFLLRSDVRSRLIDELFDARVLHLLKRNISAHDQPGMRYNVYKIDYGCYVQLINTAKSPQGVLPLDDGEGQYLDVPPDDYRAIRRAILNLEEFEAELSQLGGG